ncbi:DUF3883 domain-containing protein [Paenibacillus albidus]|uniref:DUF3883 domain-containing protein n=1 Tax=Paenibacillus albidus TaxID=2041023 RepID=UPI001BE872CC|nr:DUF3883 domain-containing protein [Paenibacillus albidus]MBT2289062.1 DUF3883 domain-containing protein [Paenibacillus albidus]
MEKVESFLKMSILNALTTLRDYKNVYPNRTTDEIIEIIQNLSIYNSSYNYNAARELITDIDFDFEVVADLRSLITFVIQREQPSWLYQLQFGREIVASCLRDNLEVDALQCLESAGLYSKDPDTSIVEWWDFLASFARNSEDSKKLKSGRIGEMLTIEYETQRIAQLNAKPKWVSVENNFAGYDVMSFDSSPSGLKQKMIEVKACKSRPISFYLTRNEWNSATNFGDNYYFHIWYIPQHKLIELSVPQVEENVPLNRGLGKWQTILIDVDSYLTTD